MQKYREESKRNSFQVLSCDIRSSALGWTKKLTQAEYHSKLKYLSNSRTHGCRASKKNLDKYYKVSRIDDQASFS